MSKTRVSSSFTYINAASALGTFETVAWSQKHSETMYERLTNLHARETG